jgi:hypothetical protein
VHRDCGGGEPADPQARRRGQRSVQVIPVTRSTHTCCQLTKLAMGDYREFAL